MTATLGGFRDPLSEAAVRDGHRRLLEGYREFLPALRSAADCAEPTELRAAVSFLRHAVGAFGRWEEAQGDARHPAIEATAFEHAFIAAETEGLAGAIRRLRDGDPDGADAVRRHADRLEAALELHVSKAEDQPLLSLPGDPSTTGGPVTVALEDEEVDRFLGSGFWGVLSTIGEQGPYAVPVSYGWSRGRLYMASGPGRKLRNLERNPVGCLSVVRVDGAHEWTSVTVEGRMLRVTRPAVWAKALRSIRRQRLPVAAFRAEELRRMLDATVFEMEVERLGGRSCGA